MAKNVAEEKLDIKRSEVIRGEWKPKKIQISFDKFKTEYLPLTKGDKKPKSSLRDECSLKHLSKTFDGELLSEINPLLIEKNKKTRKEEEPKPATINRELGCLRHMFNMAIAWAKAQSYPFDFGKNKVKLLKEPKGEDRILSEEEEKRLLEAVRLTTKSQHLEPIIITALNTRMRKGEILNLKW